MKFDMGKVKDSAEKNPWAVGDPRKVANPAGWDRPSDVNPWLYGDPRVVGAPGAGNEERVRQSNDRFFGFKKEEPSREENPPLTDDVATNDGTIPLPPDPNGPTYPDRPAGPEAARSPLFFYRGMR